MQKPVYSCRVFDIYEDEFTLGNGKKVKQTRIDHNPSVAIVAINEQNEVILFSQYRGALKQNLLEIPAGSIDKGPESPVDSARRELAEEAGFNAKKLIPLFSGYSLPGYCNEFMHYFLALELYPEKRDADEDEDIEVKALPFEQALKMVYSGKITDAKTALGLILAKAYLERQKQ